MTPLQYMASAYMASAAAVSALIDAVLFTKQFLAGLESMEPDDPMLEIRRRFHAPLHAKLDAAITALRNPRSANIGDMAHFPSSPIPAPDSPEFEFWLETVAARVHDAWMQGKHAKGLSSRKSEDGEELMVPYANLSETAKQPRRDSVMAVYNAL